MTEEEGNSIISAHFPRSDGDLRNLRLQLAAAQRSAQISNLISLTALLFAAGALYAASIARSASPIDAQHNGLKYEAPPQKFIADTDNFAHLTNLGIWQDNLVDGSVGTSELQDRSVTEPKLAVGAVTSGALANEAVTTNKLMTAAVTTEKLGPSAVTAQVIADGAVGREQLAPSSVTRDALSPEAVSTANLEPGAVTASKLAVGAVGREQLASSAVTGDALSPEAVSTANLKPGSVTSSILAAGAVSRDALAPGVVTGKALSQAAVTSASVADHSITYEKISPNTIGQLKNQLLRAVGTGGSLVGEVDSLGRAMGPGFTASRNSRGDYNVKFSVAFPVVPVVIVTARAYGRCYIPGESITRDSCQVHCMTDLSTGTPLFFDSAFSFFAMVAHAAA
eukprot:CAMPEP_0119319564 /NCGR_PEP_ID=MMETSP1333-20130426/49730_1 /TAXON_ID=418940 /ORGANISM="Scyphosphaera apsteinii, Strain RCC1455" /LENGTH=395 /DNA_ID=CAMNT_0007325997 /DNA_START=26 /DNA_END=1213 /DNA_ORIENTATION=+